jgi:hypothetical protein
VTTIALTLVLFVLLPVLAVRYGAESRPGFGSSPDWRLRRS